MQEGNRQGERGKRMSAEQNCGSCRFWSGGPGGTSSDCVRRAPVCGLAGRHAVFPWTYKGTWCGEHEPAAESDNNARTCE